MSGSRVLVPFIAAMLLSAGAWAQTAANCDAACQERGRAAATSEQNTVNNTGLGTQRDTSSSSVGSTTGTATSAGTGNTGATTTSTGGGQSTGATTTQATASAAAPVPAPNAPPDPGKLVCKETDDSTGTAASLSTTLDCDMKQRNTVVTCDTRATSAPCPNKPMAMKQTAKASFIKDYTPYLYAFARDKDDPKKAYTGAFYRGTPGDAGQTFNIFGAGGGGGGRQLGPCIQQIKLGAAVTSLSVADEAKFLRLQLDNCTNQYILHSAVFPLQKKQKEESLLFSSDDPANPGKKVDLPTHCQPLFTAKDPAQEYLADYYLKGAWKKLLNDPTYRINDDAEAEPRYPSGLTLENASNASLRFPTTGRSP